MQVSKQTINPKVSQDLNLAFIQLITDLRSNEDVRIVLDVLLSETERIAITKRLGIAVFLDKGWSYDKIKQNLKVSSATIASIQERMGSPGLKAAVEKIQVNIMADSLAEKLFKMFPFIRTKV